MSTFPEHCKNFPSCSFLLLASVPRLGLIHLKVEVQSVVHPCVGKHWGTAQYCGRLHNFGGLKPQNNQRRISTVAHHYRTGQGKTTQQYVGGKTKTWDTVAPNLPHWVEPTHLLNRFDTVYKRFDFTVISYKQILRKSQCNIFIFFKYVKGHISPKIVALWHSGIKEQITKINKRATLQQQCNTGNLSLAHWASQRFR